MVAYVYRCFDDEDRLLYVGSTVQPVAVRVRQHVIRGRAPWAKYVTRVESDPYPSEVEARDAERRAIYHACPLFNVVGNGRGIDTVARYAALLKAS